MTPERWGQLEELYQAARALPPSERTALLERADPELRAEVASLLAQEDIPGNGAFLDRPAWEGRESLLKHDVPDMPARGSVIEKRGEQFGPFWIEQKIGQGGTPTGEMSMMGGPAPAHLRPGVRLGPYQLEALLGEGGMGQVFRGRDTRLGRPVAIKTIRAERGQSPDFRIRFQREARATAALNHPHICTLYDVGEQEGTLYLVMEYVEGQTLASRLREGPLPIDQLLRRAAEVSQALAAAHERGIIHRDLKPANLMLTAAGVKVLDFGLAKFTGLEASATDAAIDITRAHTILGTPAYMSPEQTRGEELDPRSDLFSFGCVLYEAATGVRPFRGSSLPETLREVVSGHPPPPSSLRPELPAGWDSILMRTLAKDRDRRYQSAADLFSALEEVRGSLPLAGPRTEEREPDPVFGREKELAKLEASLSSAMQGNGRVLMVSGEPGIGKTALTRMFVYRARKKNADLALARGACVEQYGAGEAYLPFLDALGSLLQSPGRERVVALMRRHAPTWCLQFPAVFSSGAMDQILREATGASKDRMLRELGDALAALTAETPVLLLLEDMHWTDPASVDMLRHLAERAHGQRLLLLVTARPEDIERNNPTLKKCYTEMHARGICEEIALQVLRIEDVAAYLDAYFAPNEFPAGLASVIHNKSEGHPLFATGAIQILAERGDIVNTNGAWKLKQPLEQMELDVPVSVRSMIEKKVGLLSDEQRQALQYASIEGEVFTSTVLAALLEADELELEERLDVLGKLHRLIHAEGEEELPDGSVATVYRFTHALYQNFIYDQLLSKRRVLLHRRAGETLERVYAGQHARVAGALATHFERGRDFVKAIVFLIQAGDTALSRYANAEAVSLFSRGLELVGKLPEGQQAEQRALLLRKRALAQMALGRLKEAGEDYRAMREVCRAAGDAEGECRALLGICYVAHNIRDLPTMEQYSPEARALAERIGNRAMLAEADNVWAIYQMLSGELAQAEAAFERSIPAARSLNHRPALVNGLTWSGIVRFWRSDYAGAERVQVEASQLAAEARDGFHLPLALSYLGLTLANRGRLSEAMRSMQEALDSARRSDNALALSRIPNGIGWVSREMGDLRTAIEFNEGCVEVSQRTKYGEAEANALLNLVYDYLLAGEPGKSEQALERILPLYEIERSMGAAWRFYGIRHHAAQAEYWLARRKLDRAGEHARALLANAERRGVPKYIAVARRLLGELAAVSGDAATAEEELTRSLEPFATHPMPLIEWRNHAALGRLLAGRKHPAGARAAFKRAETLVRELAGNISDPALRKVFLEMAAVREVIAGATG
jgi:serine/threonine protein kinase/tetratricopeptide (TPR) repeat protein